MHSIINIIHRFPSPLSLRWFEHVGLKSMFCCLIYGFVFSCQFCYEKRNCYWPNLVFISAFKTELEYNIQVNIVSASWLKGHPGKSKQRNLLFPKRYTVLCGNPWTPDFFLVLFHFRNSLLLKTLVICVLWQVSWNKSATVHLGLSKTTISSKKMVSSTLSC